jgi:hypothetical protein
VHGTTAVAVSKFFQATTIAIYLKWFFQRRNSVKRPSVAGISPRLSKRDFRNFERLFGLEVPKSRLMPGRSMSPTFTTISVGWRRY